MMGEAEENGRRARYGVGKFDRKRRGIIRIGDATYIRKKIPDSSYGISAIRKRIR